MQSSVSNETRLGFHAFAHTSVWARKWSVLTMDVDGVFRSFISVRHCYRLGRSIPVLSTSYKGMYGGHQIVVDGAPGKEGQGATPSYLKGGKSAPH